MSSDHWALQKTLQEAFLKAGHEPFMRVDGDYDWSFLLHGNDYACWKCYLQLFERWKGRPGEVPGCPNVVVPFICG